MSRLAPAAAKAPGVFFVQTGRQVVQRNRFEPAKLVGRMRPNVDNNHRPRPLVRMPISFGFGSYKSLVSFVLKPNDFLKKISRLCLKP
jgi:hypothetical protein